MIRTNFRRVVDYAIDMKKDAELIDSEGVRTKDNASIAESFEIQAQMRPQVTNKVGHIALSFSPEDRDRCTNEFMVRVAQEYMQRMGIGNTQYIIVRHYDHEHPHVHLIYNRINNDGKTISDSHQRDRNRKVCKELTMKYGLYMATGKEQVNRDRLRQPDKSRYVIYDALKILLPQCTSWKDLQSTLAEQDISCEFVYRGQTGAIQGVVFILNGYRFTGSKIDRRYSYSKISKSLRLNQLAAERQKRLASAVSPHVANSVGISQVHTSHHSLTNIVNQNANTNSRNAENEVGGYDDVDNEENFKRRNGLKL
ncbi:relaxase/mobilization nuclease domain-containing protein [Phocaeicola oris]|uniref:relaxase/mobilization nuclease domain-containing protein n=1 Tax=Phocaeicola oris TaxID=2896850 RepID=UPI00234E462F|nr:relaxase/mobilization nuclease domain-containing protein [Phocaeicola oris]MCE2617118.1 relaxase/mobilization nuclease domain-containing protein [Phocaeicola oris]